MAAPNLQQINLVNAAAQTAYDGQKALNEFQAWATKATLSPNTSLIASLDFSGNSGAVPGPLTGFNPVMFTNFNSAMALIMAALSTTLSGTSVTVGQSFAAIAEYANQT